jgi:Carboxypeptidase regulatory-like domain
MNFGRKPLPQHYMHRIDRMNSLAALAAALILSAICFVATASAQETGGVKGRVRNGRGDGIGGVTVTARQNGQDVRSATANTKGEFVLDRLSPGVYNFVFDANGYASGLKSDIEVTRGKPRDLGNNLILRVDQGTRTIVYGSVFDKIGASLTGAKVDIDRVNEDGTTKRLGTGFTSFTGEFTFNHPGTVPKLRITATYKGVTGSKELLVDSAGVYHFAITLDLNRSDK